jgi:hypothetical protein
LASTPKKKAHSTTESWDLEHWPESVYPHTESRARYLLRAYKLELLDAGVLARVGRDLVVMGEPYRRWLQKRSAHVMTPDDLRGAALAKYEQRQERQQLDEAGA